MSQSPSDLERLLATLHESGGHSGEMADALAPLVFRKNRENALAFLRTPCAQRVIFVPQCLRSTDACQADERNGEYFCKGCGACKIAGIARRARELGYLGVRIVKGGSTLPRLIAETRAGAVLGVSCCIEGVMGIVACERAGIPAFCVPLSKTGCSDTDVDLADVHAALEATLT